MQPRIAALYLRMIRLMISSKRYIIAIGAVLAGLSICARADVDWFASEVVSSSGLGTAPYDNPLAVLGKPTLKFKEPNGNIFASSLVVSAWNIDISDQKTVTTINTGGELIAGFTTPIEDDPDNWYGKDFIVWGNSRFNGAGTQYLTPTTDMATYKISSSGSGYWEKSTVSVSQYPDGPWYTYTSGPFADDFSPLQAYAWDYINHTWGPEMDFTKPIDPALTPASFGNKYAAQGIDMYKSSGGGTAFDIGGLGLPVNANGRKWIKYIKITGSGGEVDAFARVGHKIDPVSIAQAKLLPDDTRVILTEQVVSAGTPDMGDCSYIESMDRSSGIKVLGRILERRYKVTLEGIMGTSGGERVIRSTTASTSQQVNIPPLGINGKSISSRGLKTTGMLLRTWGRVGNVDQAVRTFTVDDGSGSPITCIAPIDVNFLFPTNTNIVTVTGISTYHLTTSGQRVAALRMRDQDDLQ